MRFLGGNRAPGVYVVGVIYDLSERHSKFKWFELVDEKAVDKRVQDATPGESVFVEKEVPKKQSDEEEFEQSFEDHIRGQLPQVPINLNEKKKVVPDAGSDIVAPSVEDKRKKLESMTKKELIKIISDQGGVADEGMLKAMLVEIAINKTS